MMDPPETSEVNSTSRKLMGAGTTREGGQASKTRAGGELVLRCRSLGEGDGTLVSDGAQLSLTCEAH